MEDEAEDDGGSPGEKPQADVGLKGLPSFLQNLPSEYPLMKSFLESFLLTPENLGTGHYESGSVVVGHGPSNAGKPTTCAYCIRDLPAPNLGALPRPEIEDELRDDILREVRQRRDFDFPCGEQEAYLCFGIEIEIVFFIKFFFFFYRGCCHCHLSIQPLG